MDLTVDGKIKISEQDILNAIYQYVSLRYPIVHIRNTGAIIKKGNKTFFGKPKFDQKGAPDLITLVQGVALAIEVKSATGHLSPEQHQWLLRWERNRGRMVVARSIDDVLRAINKIILG